MNFSEAVDAMKNDKCVRRKGAYLRYCYAKSAVVACFFYWDGKEWAFNPSFACNDILAEDWELVTC